MNLPLDKPVRWVFAGDSITHGALHTMGWRDYTELFSERLRHELKRPRDCVTKTGVSGWRIGNIADDLDWSVLQHRPHVLSVAVGMNDCTAGEAGVAAFEATYRTVLARLREAGSPTVILHTPPRILPLDTKRESLPQYAASIRRIAEATDAILVDHYAVWQPLEETGKLAHYLANAFHPNEYGHRLMAATLLKKLGLWSAESKVGRLFMP